MKKTTLICTLILVSLLSGCAGNNASQPVSSQDTSVTSSASESTTESITTPETSVPEESTSSYEDEKFTAIGVVDSSAEESKRDIASFIYDYGSEYKTPGKTTIDKMFSEALGDKIIDDEQVQKEVADILEKCGKLETELYNAGNKIKDMPDITAVPKDDYDKWFESSAQPTAFTSMKEFYESEKSVYSDITTFEQFEKDFDTFTYQDGKFCVKGISIGRCNETGLHGPALESLSQRECLYDCAKAYKDGDNVKWAYMVLNSQTPGTSCYMVFSADLTKTDSGYRIVRNVDWSKAFGKGGK